MKNYLLYMLGVRSLIIALFCAVLAGCDTQLLANLSERDANEVLAVLMRAEIDAHKESADAGKTWIIKIPENRVVQSLDLLRAYGLPQTRYANLGELFKKDGMISTPVEERVRFVYGVSQELADTISKMDGVIVARVHIVMPQNDPLALTTKPASSSVFIKHRADLSVAALSVPIKNLVAHSVEGLEYDAVSVTFVEAHPISIANPGSSGVGSSLGVAYVVILCALAMLWIQRRTIAQAWSGYIVPQLLIWLGRLGLKWGNKS